MKKTLIILLLLCIVGCNRGDIRISPVLEDSRAPHAGWNISPDMYVQQGGKVPMTGIILWIDGLDPNDIFGEPDYRTYRVVE